MQTPLTKAIAIIKAAPITTGAKRMLLEDIEPLLVEERNNIEQTYLDGYDSGSNSVSYYGGEIYQPKCSPEHTADYFTQTYKNE